jgi:hypothetical protein
MEARNINARPQDHGDHSTRTRGGLKRSGGREEEKGGGQAERGTEFNDKSCNCGRRREGMDDGRRNRERESLSL